MTRRWTAARCGAAVLLCTWLPVSVQAAAEDRKFYSARVFDCYFPIPDDYVLNTAESGEFRFLQKPESGAGGIISITQRKVNLGSAQDVKLLERKKIQSLSVATYRVGPDRSAAVVDDGKTSVVLLGADAKLVDMMVERCVASKK
jgi:predicted ATP-grasp superfamily ATP-dependent carboligase